MAGKRRFVVRTIRNGQVRILGRDYRPDEDASRFNGRRAAFGLYWRGELQEPFVSLWGTEAAYRNVEDEGIDWPGPFCEKGVFKWVWWHEANRKAAQRRRG